MTIFTQPAPEPATVADVVVNEPLTAIILDHKGHHIWMVIIGAKTHPMFADPFNRDARAQTGNDAAEPPLDEMNRVRPNLETCQDATDPNGSFHDRQLARGVPRLRQGGRDRRGAWAFRPETRT